MTCLKMMVYVVSSTRSLFTLQKLCFAKKNQKIEGIEEIRDDAFDRLVTRFVYINVPSTC